MPTKKLVRDTPTYGPFPRAMATAALEAEGLSLPPVAQAYLEKKRVREKYAQIADEFGVSVKHVRNVARGFAKSAPIAAVLAAEGLTHREEEKPRDDNVDMQNCTTLLQGLTVGIRNLAEYAKALSIKLIHSSRSRIAGSIDSARCAGIQVATRPSNVIARTTPVNTRGSRGVA
jgi:hypothetical protein